MPYTKARPIPVIFSFLILFLKIKPCVISSSVKKTGLHRKSNVIIAPPAVINITKIIIGEIISPIQSNNCGEGGSRMNLVQTMYNARAQKGNHAQLKAIQTIEGE